MNKKDWLEKRSKGLGGTDASAVIGQNPYMSNVELFEFKTGRKIKPDISNKDYVQRGIQKERHLIELFKIDYPQYEVKYNPNPDEYDMLYHQEHKFLFASLDGELIDKETGARGVLEIKTTNILNSMHREKWNNQIPQNYYIQVLHYLMVTGYDFAILKAELRSEYNNEIRLNTRHYYMDAEKLKVDMDYLKGEEVKFWNGCILKDKQPDLILPSI